MATGKFKTKGAKILGRDKSGPDSMKDFIQDNADKCGNTQEQDMETSHTCTNTHLHKTARLHIEIDKRLAHKLYEVVFRKKQAGLLREKASQRAVIEQALEEYFQKHGKDWLQKDST
jgi:hypothetical protein